MGTDPCRRVVLRPRRARLVVYPCAAALFVVLTGVALLLPGEGEHGWGFGSRLAVVGFALGCVWFLHRLASVRVETDEEGATVVNILTRRRLDWSEVVGVRLSRDDAWMMLDVSDGSTLAAMGVQRSEGERATAQAREFARMVTEGSRTDGDR
ncbi:MAG TPA: PH domain-containing protein [Actinomycetes bacterium]|nr:PH domain-containing protein [Actinomycetes bacterium]